MLIMVNMQVYKPHGTETPKSAPVREQSKWFEVGVSLQGSPLQAAQGVPTSEVSHVTASMQYFVMIWQCHPKTC